MERFLWLGCTALVLSACDYKPTDARRSAATETRDVPQFEAIELEGDARLEVTIGEPSAVVVRGAPSVVERTATRVADNTLHIEVQRKDWSWGHDRQRLVLEIKVPHLRLLQLDGGNDVRLEGFKGGESSINVHGAARIKASGALDRLTVHVAGAGHADLSRLVTSDAKVTVDGVGSVIVNPTQSLDATMNGVGAIFYTGKPNQISSAINGLGTISRRAAAGDDDENTGSRWHGWYRDDDSDERSQPERQRDAESQSKHVVRETI